MIPPEQERQERLDAATSGRLAMLRLQPIDTTAMEHRLDAALSSPKAGGASSRRRLLSPIATGVAASLLIAISIFLAFTSGSGEARAAIVELSRLHRDIVTGRVPMTPVTSIEQANDWIADQSSGGPQLPDHIANMRVQSCCLAEVQGDLVAVAALRIDSRLVTLVVAEAPGFAHEMGRVFEIDGRRFFAHQRNGINMVMTNVNNRWLCVMGDIPDDQLAPIASQIRF